MTQRGAALEPLLGATSRSGRTCAVCRRRLAKGSSLGSGTGKHLLPWHRVCPMVDQLPLILSQVLDVVLPSLAEVGFCECLDHSLEVFSLCCGLTVAIAASRELRRDFACP